MTTDRSSTLTVSSRPIPEETVNQITHGIGFALSLVGAVVLLTVVSSSTDSLRRIGCLIYAGSLVALYAASTLSHSFENGRRRHLFRMLDQICIFLVAAGSFTPFALVHLGHGQWKLLLPIMWLFAVIGIAARVLRGTKNVPIPFFIALAWIPVLALAQIAEVSSSAGLSLVLVGALSYSVGVFFLMTDERHPYFHGIWHVLVIIGSTCHYLFILQFVAMWPV